MRQPAVAAGQSGKPVVEPRKRTARVRLAAFEQHGAQGRRQGQCRDAGHDHPAGNGGGKLFVEFAGGATHEQCRDEHRRQYQRHAEYCAGHFAHRFDGGFAYRHVRIVVHDPLDVFDDDDGVVHHQADGQHQAKQGEQVDRKPQQRQPDERTQQRYADGNGGNEGGAQVLQEQVHDDQHQCQGLDQGLGYFADRIAHVGGGIQRHQIVHAGRKTGLQRFQRGPHLVGHFQAVGTGLQIHRHGRGRLAVDEILPLVILLAQFDPGDILDLHQGVVALGCADHHVFVDARIGKRTGRYHRNGQLDLAVAGLLPDLAGADQGVLAGDGVLDVSGGNAQRRHLARVHPDADGLVGRTELRGLAGTGNALDGVQHVHGDVVAQVQRAHLAAGIVEVHHHQDAGRTLVDGHAILVHHGRQLWRGEADAVLYLHLGNVRVGILLEVGLDADVAAGGAAGRQVEQVVHPNDLLLDRSGHRL